MALPKYNITPDAIKKGAEAAKQAVKPYTPPASTPSTTGSAPAPGSQESHQSWINNASSGLGGMEAYVANQQQKYNSALASNDAAMLSKLAADMQRVGYSLNNPQQAPAVVAGMSTQSPQSYIDALNEARKQQTLAQLGKSRDAALSNINAEKATIQPRYYDARNQTASSSQQNARNFAEYMAARGGTASGANAQAELTRGMALQGNLGSLRRQETAAFDDIGRRTTDVQNAYQSDIASANAGLEADRMQAMLNDYYQQQQRELQIAQLTGMLNGQQTLAGKQFDWGKAIDTAGLTGQFNGAPTAAYQNQQFNQNMATKQFERSQFESDRDYNFAVGQQQWQNNFQQSQFDWNKAQQSWENAFQEKNFEQSMKEAAASRGLQWASLNQREKERIADEAFRQKQFDYTVQQDSLANQQQANNVSPYIDEFNSMYVSRNPSSGAITVSNPTALRNAIIARGLSDGQTDQLLLYYGLQPG